MQPIDTPSTPSRDADPTVLTATLLHDFGNTVAVILGYASLAEQRIRAVARELAASAPHAEQELAAAALDLRSAVESAENARRMVVALDPCRRQGQNTPATTDLRVDARILVVDDKPKLSALAASILEGEGYATEAFTDAGAALLHFAADPFGYDLVVTDQDMPGMTGAELTEKIHALRGEVPVILCSGDSGSSLDEQALPPGVNGLVRKPYSPAELAGMVRQLLAF